MSGAAIWYYPNSTRSAGGALSIQEIDLGEPFGALEAEPIQVGALAKARGGARSLVIHQNSLRVRLFIDRVTDPDLVAALHTFESHMRRGGVIAVANNAAKAWAGYATSPPVKGDTVIRTSGNPWGALSGSTQQVAAGDQVWISSPSPESFRDVGVVDSAAFAAVDRITLASALAYSPALTPILVRHRDFYPALTMLDPNQDEPVVQMVANGRGVSVDVDLVEALPTLARAARQGANYFLRSAAGGSF
ncbi:MAG: hypothetical protein ACO3GM_00840 [Candidatus Limnocylindrus sp.]